MLGRLLRVVGPLAGLGITAPLTLSYHDAYALPEESPPPWIAALRGTLASWGLLPGDGIERYSRYGLLYGAAWAATLGGVVVLVRARRGEVGRYRGPISLLLASGAIVLVGIVLDFASPVPEIAVFGFALQWLGFLGLVAAAGWFGGVWHRGVGALLGSAAGLVALVVGGLFTGHMPDGPGLPALLAALVSALREPWSDTDMRQPTPSPR